MKLCRLLIPLTLLLVAHAVSAQPVSLEFGGEVRVRGYSLENMWDVDSDLDGDHWALLRHRTRLSVRAELERGVVGFVRVANQHWGEGVTYAGAWEADNLANKLFVDAAWIEAPEFLGLPATLRLGRQDLIYGSGFVLFDGQSQMASTSNYLDGVRARLALAPDLDADLLWFKDQENGRALADHDDATLGGLYLTRRGGRGSQECYVLRRGDQQLDERIDVFGARLVGAFGTLDYAVEGALQRGDAASSRDHEAWGAKSELGWSPAGLDGKLRVFAGWAGLSGDDPATPGVNERWDVIQGGWPQFGDILAWTFLNLGGENAVSRFDPGYADGSSMPGEVVFGNLLMPTLGVSLQPAADWFVKLASSRLTAHRVAAGADDIGRVHQLSLRHRYSSQLTFGLYGAVLRPGDAYGPDADTIHELYWEADLDF